MKDCTCQPCWDRKLQISFGIFTSKAGVEDGLTSQIESEQYITRIKESYKKDGYECINRDSLRQV